MSADIVGPDQKLSHFVTQFVKELEDDFQSPSISKFQDYIPDCRAGLLGMEDVSSWLYSDIGGYIGTLAVAVSGQEPCA